ncbi:MAG: sulfite exporter TauE/SafE family protein [Flavobacteriaceae bacterium]|nr:sulfite exporter TauE/SafE family protein [Flavobacteriaceae bacterium]MCI5088530.1 sulfite exporter TauE/SafE family protein [Flavobacteriaceae bacterium]
MEVIEIFGYLGALLIGVVLGLIGGGGSILTVPILVYLLSVNPVTATAYSLFVVGASSLFGAYQNFKKGLVDVKTALVFAGPAFLSVYLTRRYLMPALPSELFTMGTFVVTKDLAIMVFFACIMLVAAIAMIRDQKGNPAVEEDEKPQYNYPMIILEGTVVGALTGIVGAGGGFLIIPALVLFAKLPMKKAVASSLLIIAIKSLFGFIGDVQTIAIDWIFLGSFTALSILGIFLGVYLSKYIPGHKLKKSFGWFVLLMAFYILYKELV